MPHRWGWLLGLGIDPRVLKLSFRIQQVMATAYAIMENGTGHEVGMGRVTASESWILLCGCLPLTS